MKKISIMIFVLVIAGSVNAQYAHSQPNDTGIYTAETKSGDKMTIALNSDKNNFTVDYQLMEEFNKAVLIVKEPVGKIITMEELDNIRGQILITTDNWPSGNYTLSLFADKQLLLEQKIALNK